MIRVSPITYAHPGRSLPTTMVSAILPASCSKIAGISMCLGAFKTSDSISWQYGAEKYRQTLQTQTEQAEDCQSGTLCRQEGCFLREYIWEVPLSDKWAHSVNKQIALNTLFSSVVSEGKNPTSNFPHHRLLTHTNINHPTTQPHKPQLRLQPYLPPCLPQPQKTPP